MKGIRVYLAGENYEGELAMSTPSSQIIATRVSRENLSEYENELNGPGIYFLLIGSDSIYVGQTGLDTIKKRIVNTHSGTIDSSWHTVIAFRFNNKNISSNELYYIENAMCEYVHNNHFKCLTTTPSKDKCTESYRAEHYNLNTEQLHSCKQHCRDIKHYISLFPMGIFPAEYKKVTPLPQKSTELFFFKSDVRDSEGQALIGIKQGHSGARTAILKKGSKISKEVSMNFKGSQSLIDKRQEYIKNGVIVNRILQEDISFNSQSAAAMFLNGTSMDGNTKWKTAEGIPLKELL